MAIENQRDHFRIMFPLELRPKLILGQTTYDVTNISESGLQFDCTNHPLVDAEGELLNFVLVFKDLTKYDLCGTVVRIVKNRVALKLGKPIPLSKIMEIHRELIKKYGRDKIETSEEE